MEEPISQVSALVPPSNRCFSIFYTFHITSIMHNIPPTTSSYPPLYLNLKAKIVYMKVVENKGVTTKPPSSFSSSLTLLLFLLLFSLANYASSSTDTSFSPSVNYLIDCGSSKHTELRDGRTFKSDRETASLLSTIEDLQLSVDSIDHINVSSFSVPHSSLLPLYLTARVFHDDSTYTFYISKTGLVWIRLYLFPLMNPSFNLTEGVFSVHTDYFVLLQDFSVKNNDKLILKEFLINVSTTELTLTFKPMKHSLAFINAIEVVSAPDTLITDSATAISPLGQFTGLSEYAFQVIYRVNVGGPAISPNGDPLSRTWESDGSYNVSPQDSKVVIVSTKRIKYPPTGRATPLIAPEIVYATAVEMNQFIRAKPNFNLSWIMNVENSFSYLIRMHFCDIVSKRHDQFSFNVYLNGMLGVSGLDLLSQTNASDAAFYQDFVLNASAITNGSILVQVGPTNLQQGTPNAILNGFEVIKMSNCAGSLDGLFTVDGKYNGPSSTSDNVMKTIAGVGLGLAVATMMLLMLVMYIRWHKRPQPQGWEEKHKNNNNLSSRFLPFKSNCTPMLYPSKSIGGGCTRTLNSPHKSKNDYHFPRLRHGKFFHFSELQKATKNFSLNRVIGVGGFGKVYLGTLEDQTVVAIKRGDGSSEQGINEFKTELDMLSNFRHRHLVSLIGYCDENSEMVLVYEYMANGPFRSHLYGTNLPPLSWQKRLEVCIGAARGLHYLHTGAAQTIIHRDVKTTNILLDENFVAKVSDFGLSKVVREKAEVVSTVVKGSFGYLDPEYFMSQRITKKSDIYSFGVVLVEVLCGRPPICPTLPVEQVNLADFAMKQHRIGMIHNVIDPYIVDTIYPASLRTFVEVAEKCLAHHGIDRPSIGDVLWHLEYALQLQEAASYIESPKDECDNGIACQQQQSKNDDDDVTYLSDVQLSDASNRTDDGCDLFSQISNFKGR